MAVRAACFAASGVLIMGVAACGVSQSDDTNNTAPPSTASPDTPTASPTGPVSTYRLDPSSTIIIGSDPGKITTKGGTLSVRFQSDVPSTASPVLSGAYGLEATSTSGAPWQLSLSVTSQNRVLSGTIVIAGITWNVVPTTGLVTSTLTQTGATFVTSRAVTLLRNDLGDNVPFTFTLVGAGGTFPPPSPTVS